jgi:ElaB/YqjD/DUF883 family membrane-anchored ribosome-binding protein
MASLSSYRDEIGHDLEAEISSLRKEVASLKRRLGRRGGKTYAAGQEQLSELYEEAQEWLTAAMPLLRRRARAAGRAVEDNSTAIIVGAAVVGLLATLLLARRR